MSSDGFAVKAEGTPPVSTSVRDTALESARTQSRVGLPQALRVQFRVSTPQLAVVCG